MARTRRGEGRRAMTVSAYLDEREVLTMERHAAERGVTRSEVIREAVIGYTAKLRREREAAVQEVTRDLAAETATDAEDGYELLDV